jgi:hypothetical protein
MIPFLLFYAGWRKERLGAQAAAMASATASSPSRGSERGSLIMRFFRNKKRRSHESESAFFIY